MVPSSSSIRLRFADLIQEQLKRVGIQAELGKVPAPNFFARQDAGDFDAMISTINTDPSVNGAKQYWSTEGDQSRHQLPGVHQRRRSMRCSTARRRR